MTVIHSKRDSLYLFKCRCWNNETQRPFEVYIKHDNWAKSALDRVLMSNPGYERCTVQYAEIVNPSELRSEVAA